MFEHELTQLEQQHLLRRPVVIRAMTVRVTIAGKSLLLMCSNDYLGLSNHPSLQEAALTAMERYGFGSGASRLVSGSSAVHRELEQRIAYFKGTEAAITFNSGYAANTGIIPAITGEGDAVLSDSLNHASIVDGCRLSRARVLVYRHKDMDHLEELLKSCGNAGRRLLVTDGVFSMDGDIAPLPDLVFLAGKYAAVLMLTMPMPWAFSERAAEEQRSTSDSKAASIRWELSEGVRILWGLCSRQQGFDRLSDEPFRSYIYSTALPPAVCAASIAAITIVENEPERRERLWNNRIASLRA
jgi:7-keto-8-aminopelargonate synthetase-like enzyme